MNPPNEGDLTQNSSEKSNVPHLPQVPTSLYTDITTRKFSKMTSFEVQRILIHYIVRYIEQVCMPKTILLQVTQNQKKKKETTIYNGFAKYPHYPSKQCGQS